MIRGLLRTARPHQWVKNLFVLAPLVFAQELFELDIALRALAAAALFSLASSSVYFINDVRDIDADRAHPVKRTRPIASGLVPVGAAWAAAFCLAGVALFGGLALSWAFAAAVGSYLVLNVAYTLKLKRIPYVDVLCIALGFELRVLAGSLAAEVAPSFYLLVVTFLLANFLGFGKRMHEFLEDESARHRASLASYRLPVLSTLLIATGLATVATYVIYTLDPKTRAALGTHYLVGTSVFTLFGVLRFLHLVRNRPRADSPTEEMLRDRAFLVNLCLWGLFVVGLIYLT